MSPLHPTCSPILLVAFQVCGKDGGATDEPNEQILHYLSPDLPGTTLETTIPISL